MYCQSFIGCQNFFSRFFFLSVLRKKVQKLHSPQKQKKSSQKFIPTIGKESVRRECVAVVKAEEKTATTSNIL
jgi:hypothetical protein